MRLKIAHMITIMCNIEWLFPLLLDSKPRYIYSQGSTLWNSYATITQAGRAITVEQQEEEIHRNIEKVLALSFHYEKEYVFMGDVELDVIYRTQPDAITEDMVEVTVNTRHVEGKMVSLSLYH